MSGINQTIQTQTDYSNVVCENLEQSVAQNSQCLNPDLFIAHSQNETIPQISFFKSPRVFYAADSGGQGLTAVEQRLVGEIEEVGRLYEKGKYQKAYELAQRVSRDCAQHCSKDNPMYAISLNWLAKCQSQLGDIDAAKMTFAKALEVCPKNNENGQYVYANIYGDYFATLMAWELYEEAAQNIDGVFEAVNLVQERDVEGEIGVLEMVCEGLDQGADLELAYEMREKLLGLKKEIYKSLSPELMLAYYEIGVFCNEKGLYDEAIKLLLKASEINSKSKEYNKIDQGICNYELGCAYFEIAEYKKSTEYLKEALVVFEEYYGVNDLSTSRCSSRLGLAFSKLGAYDQAIPFLERAIKINKIVLGAHSQGVADDLFNVGTVYEEMGSYELAIERFTQSKEISKEILGAYHLEVASCCYRLGMVYNAVGEVEKALKALLERFEIFTKNYEKGSKEYCLGLFQLGQIAEENNHLLSAVDAYKYLYDCIDLMADEHKKELAERFYSLADTYKFHGYFAEAEECFVYAEKVYDAASLATTYNAYMNKGGMAGNYFWMGKFDLAETKFNAFVNGIKTIPVEEWDYIVGQVYVDYANYLFAKGEVEKGRFYLEESLKITERLYTKESAEYADVLFWYGILLREQFKDKDFALELVNEALNIASRNNVEQETIDRMIFIIETNFSYITYGLDSNNEYEDALLSRVEKNGISNIVEAQHVLKKMFYYRTRLDLSAEERQKKVDELHGYIKDAEFLFAPPYSLMKAELYKQLCAYYYQIDSDMYKEAFDLITKAIDIYEEQIGKDAFNLIYALCLLSQYYQYYGDDVQAKKVMDRAYELVSNKIDLYLYNADAREAVNLVRTYYATLCFYLTVFDKEEDVLKAYNLVIQQKGFSSQFIRNLKSILLEESENKETIERLQLLSSEIARLSQMPMIGDENQVVLNQVMAKTKERGELERQLLTDNQTMIKNNQVHNATVTDVVQRLPENTVMIEFVKYSDFRLKDNGINKDQIAYTAFVVLPGSPAMVKRIELGRIKEIEEAISVYRGMLESARPNVYWSNKIDEAAAKVRELIWDPISEVIGDYKNVFVVPDASITGVSFAGLPTGQGQDTRYLVEDYTFGYLENAKDLISIGQREKPAGNGALLVGDVDYDLAGGEVLAYLNTTTGVANDNVLRGNTGLACEDRAFSSLTGTKEEVDNIQQQLASHDYNVVSLTGSQATEQNVIRAAQNSQIVHLATHGFFGLDENCDAGGAELNPMVLSGVVLAGVNQTEVGTNDGGDGVLTAEEVARMDFRNTDMVVLSACHTGLGEIQTGEGVMGLRRAFFQAGARTMVMSLWAASDQSTSNMMQSFYELELSSDNDLNKLESLRQVQLEMLEANRQQYGHGMPFNWAEFVVSGDWE